MNSHGKTFRDALASSKTNEKRAIPAFHAERKDIGSIESEGRECTSVKDGLKEPQSTTR